MMNRQPLADHATRTALPVYTEAAFRVRAGIALLSEPDGGSPDPRTGRPSGRSDWDLTPEISTDLVVDLAADTAANDPPRPAAVLVPIVLRDELTVLLTQRTETMSSHAGQIAFPGGRVDATDVDAKAAALREAHEEIGLEARFIEPLGYLDSYRTGTGYQITPLVALVRPGFTLTLAPSEVADVFEVPLRFLMTAANHQRHERTWRGRTRAFWAMPYGDRYIWGATAGMVKNLFDRLAAS